ncbi:rhodanese-like domain-containing protein [Burkholderiaceae bacterium FT117]|uniref:rhodanese-like domain-containing protein n=1 Tax=Zeimonas sediminis TaxID=2944268 RepID=UPI002342ED3E|nr:rhodanese-like domain-containing protein [Zeimonas sediminis]MCM5571006.1 rhodanese-like domain-containing protein [Zeimonas sediminis]
MTTMRAVSAERVRAMLSDGQEIAFLDVREEGVFSRAHAFWAVPAPFSHLERRLGLLVPRRGTRVVLMDDDGGGLVRRAAERISAWGYEDVAILDGGLRGWRDAGFEVFAGVHVPSKAFGEVVEHRDGTPSIDPAQLKAWRAEGRPVVVLDSRPFDEFHRFSLPGGIDCPGAELVHRAFGLVDDATTIVVNCAGRTRSIIGAQSLINAGIPNPVVALRNGTGGWHLAGEALAHGSRAVAPPPGVEGLARAVEASRRVAARFGVEEIGADTLRRFQDEAGRRTLYLFDVRTPEEYEAGHLPGSRSAPGGQLVQSTDFYAGTRGARIVLVDDNGVRARMTASWLRQIGWGDACVLAGGLRAAGLSLEKGPEPAPALGDDAGRACETVSAGELQSLVDAGAAVVVDLASSLRYRAGHVPGAWFAVRARFDEAFAKLPAQGELVLASDDGEFARLAAADAIAAAPGRKVRVLAGGTRAWAAAGLPLAGGFERLASEPDDVWYSPYDHEDLGKAMAEYLSWEVGLVEQLAREGIAFPEFPAAG